MLGRSKMVGWMYLMRILVFQLRTERGTWTLTYDIEVWTWVLGLEIWFLERELGWKGLQGLRSGGGLSGVL
jgi:hypothetical protein